MEIWGDKGLKGGERGERGKGERVKERKSPRGGLCSDHPDFYAFVSGFRIVRFTIYGSMMWSGLLALEALFFKKKAQCPDSTC